MTRSLWHKAWLESRIRFLLGAVLLAAIAIAIMVNFGRSARECLDPHCVNQFGLDPNSWYRVVGFMVFGGPPSMVFVIMTLVLGLGGLQRERASGTSGFTLALPVNRGRLEGMRAAMGLLQTVALALIPALLVIVLSPALGRHDYPAMPALRSAGLWAVCGAVWFSAAFLWSTVLAAEQTATVVSMLTPLVWYTIARYTPLSRFPSLDIYGVMVGRTTEWWMPYHDWISGLMIGPMPWLTLTLLAAAAALLLSLAGRLTMQRSF